MPALSTKIKKYLKPFLFFTQNIPPSGGLLAIRHVAHHVATLIGCQSYFLSL